MACACKVNQEIDRIQKYYSIHNNGEVKKTGMSVNKKDAAITMAAYLVLLPLLPFVFIGLIFFSLFSKNKRLSLKNFLGFIHKVKNGRKQQDI